MKKSVTYHSIDLNGTGLKLKRCMERASMTVKEIQEYLHLSCPQPIYRWFSGKILPSVDHLLALSDLFGVHMEELLVKTQSEGVLVMYGLENSTFRMGAVNYAKWLMKNAV